MFQIDPISRTPVYEQIVNQAEKMIAAGLMAPGYQMPSVRSLSVELSVNPNTIQRAYGALDLMGLITSVPGKGCFVANDAKEIIKNKYKRRLSELSVLVSELWLSGISPEEITAAVENGISAANHKEAGND